MNIMYKYVIFPDMAVHDFQGGAEMGLISLILLAAGLSMDAFAVSVCKGLSAEKAGIRCQLICGAWFGGFQALMPVIGYFFGSLFLDAIEAFDHWIAFGLLFLIGSSMIYEALWGDGEKSEPDLSPKAMLPLAISTSIDAMAAGLTLAMAGNVSIFPAALLIGAVTFVFSAAGVKIGSLFGARFQQPAQVTGGIILILLGVKILLEHLWPMG